MDSLIVLIVGSVALIFLVMSICRKDFSDAHKMDGKNDKEGSLK